MSICWCLSWELIDKRSIVANKKLTNKLYVNYLTIINFVDHSHAFLILFTPRNNAAPFPVRITNLSTRNMNQVCLVCLLTLHPYPHTLFPCPISLRRQGPDQAALRLLDRFARDALQQARKEGYIKIATVFKDLADARTFWTANILIASIDTDCNDKSG